MFKATAKRSLFCVGEPYVLKIEYRHDAAPADAGSSLLVGYHTGDGAGMVQASDPESPNYLWIESDSDAKFTLTSGQQRHSLTPFPGTVLGDMFVFELKVVSGTLQPGDTVTFNFGEKDNPASWFLPGKSAESPLKFYYQLIGVAAGAAGHLAAAETPAPYGGKTSLPAFEENREWQYTGVKFDIKAGDPVTADVLLPNVVEPNQENEIRIVVYDRYANQVKNFDSRVMLDLKGAVVSGLSATGFSTGPEGYALVPMVFEREMPYGCMEFNVTGLGGLKTNPFKVSSDNGKNRIFWGDLDGRSSLSDGGPRNPDDFFRYARDIRGLDFAALSDSCLGLARPGCWQNFLQSVDNNNFDDLFIALAGYEMLPVGIGPRTVYFPDCAGKLVVGVSKGSEPVLKQSAGGFTFVDAIHQLQDFDGILKEFGKSKVLWSGRRCGKLCDTDTKALGLFEVYSEWGASDDLPTRIDDSVTVSQVFKQGMSPGLIAGGGGRTAKAGFTGHQVSSGGGRYPAGLTAVLAQDLTRKDIFSALEKGHCYATTGSRIVIEPKVKLQKNKIEVKLFVAGTADLDHCRVFKNGKEVHLELFEGGDNAVIVWEDDKFSANDTCYLRIRQMDGETAWINPTPFAKK